MRKLRMGMVGGGPGAFIGEVHRMASRIDGQIELVCGAFSSSAKKSKPEGERMDFVSVVTPNHVHFDPCKQALKYGFHVVCDKPATLNLSEAKKLKKLIDQSGLVYALTHNYTGYPMVKEAKEIIKKGKLGKIRRVVVEYPQGWLSTRLEASEQKQAKWRTDPKKSGVAGAMGDIGSHAENLAEYITDLKIKKICADINTFVPGRQLDDDGAVFLEFDSGAKGLLFATQIAAGEENDLNIRVYGEKGGLRWCQMNPNSLEVNMLDKPAQIIRTGYGPQSKAAQGATRIPAGHPEGYLEAFANIYKMPGIDDGIRGMRFIEKVIESGKSSKKWIHF